MRGRLTPTTAVLGCGIILLTLFLTSQLQSYLDKLDSKLQRLNIDTRSLHGTTPVDNLQRDTLAVAEESDIFREKSDDIPVVVRRQSEHSAEHHGRESVFYIESSGKKSLAFREVCGIESASRYHDDVVVYIRDDMDEESAPMQMLSRLANVRVLKYQAGEVFRGTPLASWHHSGILEQSAYPIEHLSDALRMALLAKYGGIYSDFDCLFRRSVQELEDGLSYHFSEWLANGIMIFKRPDNKLTAKYLNRCMAEFAANYNVSGFVSNGPMLLSRIITQDCGGTIKKLVDKQTCYDFKIYPARYFLPVTIYEPERQQLLKDGNAAAVKKVGKSYLLHWFNDQLYSKTFRLATECLLCREILANCPLTARFSGGVM